MAVLRMTGLAKCDTFVDEDSTAWCDVAGERDVDTDDVTGNVVTPVVFVVAEVECGLLLPGTIKTKKYESCNSKIKAGFSLLLK